MMLRCAGDFDAGSTSDVLVSYRCVCDGGGPLMFTLLVASVAVLGDAADSDDEDALASMC